nr:transcriptional activator protein [Olea europaea geminivirus]QTH79687.1 transcriptional activator protein [Olea europaea geminivirus]QTH79695.1 transcriptional activator protein [Olea europaea geminivirus]UFZ14012.1 transcriptional activator protein [Olea europaea geminivirus]
MQNSSSPNPPSIEAKHQQCERKRRLAIKPRRLTLPCGCIIYQTIDCRNNGFVHKGATHMAATTSRGVLLEPKQSNMDTSPTLWTDDESTVPSHLHGGTKIQLQSQNAVADKASMVDYPHLDDITTSPRITAEPVMEDDDFWDFIPTALFLYP